MTVGTSLPRLLLLKILFKVSCVAESWCLCKERPGCLKEELFFWMVGTGRLIRAKKQEEIQDRLLLTNKDRDNN